jgi:hypothetical protein
MRGNRKRLVGDFKLLFMGGNLYRLSEEGISEARNVQRLAETLAGVDLPRNASSLVPPRWTAWLLMERAGVPHDLIAHVCRVSPGKIRRGVQKAKTFMLFWAPYSTTVFRLMGEMMPFGKPPVPMLKPAREDACAVRAG